MNEDRFPIGPWGCPIVKGRCPACHHSSLFLADGGYVTCSNLSCPSPTVVADQLLEVVAS